MITEAGCGMKIYLDNCCLNRPYDDLSNDIVRLEAETVLSIISGCENGEWELLVSDVLLDEILIMSSLVRKQKVLLLYDVSESNIELTDEIVARAKEFERFSIKSYDALHLASAEIGNADVLLTTDRKFISVANRSDATIKVKNPLKWLTEVRYER
ncbi:hypothetical protein FACS18949_14830 [Clostridia bacterium]|nr:hypothetical protein FACS189425_04990 [Clostridia bacterium]GHV35962.1 hypothetical protein FACS18949_14830 [Clostridia bacterium]